MLKVMLSVGEASGDLHGASLAGALWAVEPAVRVFGLGGNMMRAAGVEINFDIADLGVFGLLEIVKKLPQLKRLRKSMAELMDSESPDVLVVIDYGGFNLPLAQIAKSKGIPVVYYIPPKVWVWGKGRAKKIAQAVEEVAVIFPFETEVYQQAGAKVTFVGNPLVDIAKPSMTKEEACKFFGADPARHTVLLMPGSRNQEIANLLPVMLAAAAKMLETKPECQFFLPVASTISREMLQNIIDRYRVPVCLTQTNTYDLMQVADVAIAASGTVTLEAALVGLPAVIIYKVAPLTYFFGKFLVKIPHFGLPNIVAGRRVLPELLQSEVTAENIAMQTLAILTNETLRNQIMQELGKIRRSLGEGGAVEKVARMVIDTAAAAHGGKR